MVYLNLNNKKVEKEVVVNRNVESLREQLKSGEVKREYEKVKEMCQK